MSVEPRFTEGNQRPQAAATGSAGEAGSASGKASHTSVVALLPSDNDVIEAMARAMARADAFAFSDHDWRRGWILHNSSPLNALRVYPSAARRLFHAARIARKMW
jgi:hypothetical protein